MSAPSELVTEFMSVIDGVEFHLRSMCEHSRLSHDCATCDLRIDVRAARDEYDAWVEQTHHVMETLRFTADLLQGRFASPNHRQQHPNCAWCGDLVVEIEEAISRHDALLGLDD